MTGALAPTTRVRPFRPDVSGTARPAGPRGDGEAGGPQWS
jgi:hypothetical protein